MTKSKENGLSSIALISLFIMGDAVISFPFLSGVRGCAVSFFAAGLLCFFISPLIYRLTLKIPKYKTKKAVFYPLYIFLFLLSLLSLFTAVRGYSRFLSGVMLKTASLPLCVILFLIPVIFLALQNDRVILKFSIISQAVSIIILGVFIFITLPEYRFDLKRLLLPENAADFIFPFLFYCLMLIILLFTAGIYIHLITENGFKTAFISGGALGGALTLLSLLNSVFVLGIAADNNPFPYAAAISTVTVGDFFTRMDGFSYFLFFMTALVKASVSALIIKKCIRIMIKK